MTMTKAIRAWFERLNDLVGLVGAERGIGRTHRAIAALEPGQVYIVHTSSMVSHARMIMNKLGVNNPIMAYYGFEDRHRLAGRRLVVDHAVWAGLSPVDTEWLLVHVNG